MDVERLDADTQPCRCGSYCARVVPDASSSPANRWGGRTRAWTLPRRVDASGRGGSAAAGDGSDSFLRANGREAGQPQVAPKRAQPRKPGAQGDPNTIIVATTRSRWLGEVEPTA